MKKTYQKPSIRVRKVEAEGIMAASVSAKGNTGITLGEGDTPGWADAKRHSIFDDPGPSQPSSGIGW